MIQLTQAAFVGLAAYVLVKLALSPLVLVIQRIEEITR
jgi:hypothetical protein